MIKTKDQRKFFTPKENYHKLLEFSKVFNAEISIVKVKEVEILDLEQLAPAICDTNYKINAEYQILEVKSNKKFRKNILENAKEIKEFIKQKFLNKDVVSLRILVNIFSNHNVTIACLCNHLTQVRKLLTQQGYSIKKLGGGKYTIN